MIFYIKIFFNIYLKEHLQTFFFGGFYGIAQGQKSVKNVFSSLHISMSSLILAQMVAIVNHLDLGNIYIYNARILI